MQPASWRPGAEYISFGVTWRSGGPCLEVADTQTSQMLEVPLQFRHIAFRVSGPEKYCTGRYGLIDVTDTTHIQCPERCRIENGTQCDQCAARDEFRLIHHAHTGGAVPAELARYIAQPHWVYIATFADGSSKVGTAAMARKQSRLDEQGAFRATYVAETADGKAARQVEDAITSGLSVTQFKRRTSKLAALGRPAATRTIDASHGTVAEGAARLIGRLMPRMPGVRATAEDWVPPEAMKTFLSAPPAGWTHYPNDLRSGEHGLFISSCAGQAVLAATRDAEDDPLLHVTDLGLLKGKKIRAGDFVFPSAPIQEGLF